MWSWSTPHLKVRASRSVFRYERVMDNSELLGVLVLVAAIGVIMWHYRPRG